MKLLNTTGNGFYQNSSGEISSKCALLERAIFCRFFIAKSAYKLTVLWGLFPQLF